MEEVVLVVDMRFLTLGRRCLRRCCCRRRGFCRRNWNKMLMPVMKNYVFMLACSRCRGFRRRGRCRACGRPFDRK